MIKIVGSNYCYQGEKLASPEIIRVMDHHYNEELLCYPIKTLLDNSVCNPRDHLVVFDHVLQHQDHLQDYQLLCLPIFVVNACEEFNSYRLDPDWNMRSCTFNFMINKVRLHREFLLLLIEHFALTDYSYTLCWKQASVRRENLIRYTHNEFYQQLIRTTKVHIPTRQFLLGSETLLDRGLRYHHITNVHNYQQFLQKQVFEPSCISVITEPAFFERETIITEKTIMAIWAGTLPIWVGGWRIPDYMRSRGFDVFDDIVDHSYQDLADPFDRCYSAIERNLDLFHARNRVYDLIDAVRPRLKHNLDLLKQNCFRQEIAKNLGSYPAEIAKMLQEPGPIGVDTV